MEIVLLEKNKMKNERAFSLVELIIVVLIIGALAVIGIPRIIQNAHSAKVYVCKTNVNMINRQIEQYMATEASLLAALTDVTENTDYFPDGAPACPFGTAYVMDGSTHKVIDHSHSTEEGGSTALSPEQAIQQVSEALSDIVDSNPGTPLADKIEDAMDELLTALVELDQPDNQAAVGNIEGAVGKLEAAVKDGLLDAEQGIQLMDDLSATAKQLADTALDQAIAQGGDPDVINDAQQSLLEGDGYRADEAFKDAVNKYKDALGKAESAL